MDRNTIIATKIAGFLIASVMILFFSLVVNYVTPGNFQWFTRTVAILISLRIVAKMRTAVRNEINKIRNSRSV